MLTTGVRGKKVLYLFLFLPFLLSSCLGTISTTKAMRKADPKASPARTVTSFSDSLSCMDDLFLEKKIKTIYISSQDIKDKAKRGKMGDGITDMLLSAISEISSTSNAIRYVGYKSSLGDLATLNVKHVPSALAIPDYYIVGSVSQADDYVISGMQGLGVATDSLDTGYSLSNSASVIGLDLNIFEIETATLIPGLTARNSLAYGRQRKSGNLGGLMLKTGLTYYLNFSRSEGPQQAVRTLLELSLVELMGKLTKLPYWDCLDLDITAKEMYKPIAKWWAVKSKDEKITEVEGLLLNMGRLNPAGGKIKTWETIAAITEFQEDYKMEPDGRVSLDLFITLKSMENKNGYSGKPKVRKREELKGGKVEKQARFQTWQIAGGGGYFGSVSSMATGSDESIHVAYFDPLKHSLKYAKKNGNSWSIKTIDSNLENVGADEVSVHIAVDIENRPHVLYAFRPEGGGAVVRYASLGTSWKKDMIEMFSASADRVPGTYIFFSGNNVNLLYSGNQLTHVKKKGIQWVASDSYGMEDYPELDLQKIFVKKGKVYFSYGKFNELVTAWNTGKEWVIRRVFLGKKIFNASALVDSKGNIHTIGFTEEGEIKHIVARKNSGTILKKESLKKLSGASDGSTVQVAAAIASDDSLHILYSVSGKMKESKNGLYYILAGKDGSKSFSKIEAGDLIARSINVSLAGKINFTYFDKSSGELLFGSSSE